MVSTTVPAPARRYHRIQSQTVGRVVEAGPEKGQPIPPFEGTFLGQRFIQGVAEVPVDATWPCVNPENLQPKHIPVIQWLTEDFGMKDLDAEPTDADLERLTAPD